MFEGVFEVFNRIEQGSLILKNPKNMLKVAINYLESSKVYRMFEGVFEVFNRLHGTRTKFMTDTDF